MKINYGSGDEYLEGYVNIDKIYIKNSAFKPDLICDITKQPLPFGNDSIEVVSFIHCLEHIEQKFWFGILDEFFRVLQPEGFLYLAYPEFEVCAKYFMDNHRGQRDFWRQTLYGRQLHPGDYHVVPMRTIEVMNYLEVCGFKDMKSTPAPNDEYETFLTCKKGIRPLNREAIFKKEIFNIN